MFIRELVWLEAFAPRAITRLEGQLSDLDMKIKYFKLHALIGMIALHHVDGELRQAGLLNPGDMPTLLERLNAPTPPLPLTLPRIRPIGVHRPLVARDAGWMVGERVRTESVGDDIATWSDQREEHPIA